MTIVVTLAVCSAFMLPVATPSNAVALGSGEVSIKPMVKVGVWLNLTALVATPSASASIYPLGRGLTPRRSARRPPAPTATRP